MLRRGNRGILPAILAAALDRPSSSPPNAIRASLGRNTAPVKRSRPLRLRPLHSLTLINTRPSQQIANGMNTRSVFSRFRRARGAVGVLRSSLFARYAATFAMGVTPRGRACPALNRSGAPAFPFSFLCCRCAQPDCWARTSRRGFSRRSSARWRAFIVTRPRCAEAPSPMPARLSARCRRALPPRAFQA